MLTYGGDMGNDTCMMIEKHKHVSQCMTVHAYIGSFSDTDACAMIDNRND